MAAAVESGEADEGVVPIENSVGGSVSVTLDLLIHEQGYHIKRELNLAVVHNLMAKPGTELADAANNNDQIDFIGSL